MKNNTMRMSCNSLGIKINSIAELTLYHQLNNVFWICDDEEYYFNDEVVYTDEDGNEQHREPTREELFQRLVKVFNDGEELYAKVHIDCGQIDDYSVTRLTSNFMVGQEVYVMDNNKICKKYIQRIVLSVGDGQLDSNNRVNLSRHDYNNNEKSMKMTDTYESVYVLANKKRWSSDYQKYRYYTIDICKEQDVFATKEELVKYLMNESK